MKEVVGVLDRVVRDEALDHIMVGVDETARPFLMDQLPKHLAEKVIRVLHLPVSTPEHDVLAQTLDVMREHDAKTDAERVQAMIDASAANGRAVVGADATLYALTARQVEELIIAARPDVLVVPPSFGTESNRMAVGSTAPQTDARRLELAGELVARAQQNAARIRFIEDSRLLGDVGGVGAILRFRA